MNAWIRSWHRAGTFTPPASQLITNGVPGPTVTFDGRHWNAADGTIWRAAPGGHIQPGPDAGSTDVEVCQILPDGQIPGQTALFD